MKQTAHVQYRPATKRFVAFASDADLMAKILGRTRDFTGLPLEVSNRDLPRLIAGLCAHGVNLLIDTD